MLPVKRSPKKKRPSGANVKPAGKARLVTTACAVMGATPRLGTGVRGTSAAASDATKTPLRGVEPAKRATMRGRIYFGPRSGRESCLRPLRARWYPWAPATKRWPDQEEVADDRCVGGRRVAPRQGLAGFFLILRDPSGRDGAYPPQRPGGSHVTRPTPSRQAPWAELVPLPPLRAGRVDPCRRDRSPQPLPQLPADPSSRCRHPRGPCGRLRFAHGADRGRSSRRRRVGAHSPLHRL